MGDFLEWEGKRFEIDIVHEQRVSMRCTTIETQYHCCSSRIRLACSLGGLQRDSEFLPLFNLSPHRGEAPV